MDNGETVGRHSLRLTLCGDEHFHYYKSEDGAVMLRNASGDYCYASATLDFVTDDNTGKILDMDNLRTGGEGESTIYRLHYKVKYTGKANIPYTIRSTVNDMDLGKYDVLRCNLSDTTYSPSGDINAIYQMLHALYGITTFKFSMQYQLSDDTEWQPLDKDRPYLVINPVASGINTAQSAAGAVDASAPYYTLQGIRLSVRPTLPGLYIRKGRKMVIR